MRKLDVAASGRVLGALIDAHLVDEARHTVVGALLGRTARHGTPRTLWCAMQRAHTAHSAPLLELLACRVIGPHHVMLRWRVLYSPHDTSARISSKL